MFMWRVNWTFNANIMHDLRTRSISNCGISYISTPLVTVALRFTLVCLSVFPSISLLISFNNWSWLWQNWFGCLFLTDFMFAALQQCPFFIKYEIILFVWSMDTSLIYQITWPPSVFHGHVVLFILHTTK